MLGAGRGARLSYGVRAIVQFSFGKAVGGTSMREVPLYDLPSTAARSLAIAAARLGERLDEIAKRLRDAARKAISDLHRKLGSEIAGQLKDDFLAAMDRPVIDAITGLAESFAAGEIGDTAIDAELLDRGRRTALAFFDAAFPVIGGDTPSVKIAKVRRELVRDLSRLAPRLHTRPESEETAA